MKKKVLTKIILVAFATTLAVIPFVSMAKEKKIEVGYLCCNNYDGECRYDDGFVINGAFWVH